MQIRREIEFHLEQMTDRSAEAAYYVPMARNWHALGRGYASYIHLADPLREDPSEELSGVLPPGHPGARTARWRGWLRNKSRPGAT